MYCMAVWYALLIVHMCKWIPLLKDYQEMIENKPFVFRLLVSTSMRLIINRILFILHKSRTGCQHKCANLQLCQIECWYTWHRRGYRVPLQLLHIRVQKCFQVVVWLLILKSKENNSFSIKMEWQPLLGMLKRRSGFISTLYTVYIEHWIEVLAAKSFLLLDWNT